MKTINLLSLVFAAVALTACSSGSTSYSLLEDGSTFRQNSGTQNAKIDVLWVIDNSGSMQSSQQNLADNFPVFLDNFTSKGLDFRMAVTNTQSYLALPVFTPFYNMVPTPSFYEGLPQDMIAKFRDRAPNASTGSGVFLIEPSTPNLLNVFITNAMQGINGRGDERSLQSMRTTLASSHNNGFVRGGGFLAVIILTDEDDFSHDGTQQFERYDRPLHPISDYVTFLDGLTASSGATRRYSVNSITVKDQACLDSIFNGAQKIGNRVMELATATGGVKASICGDFAQELELISKAIIELSTQFSLGTKQPIESTIRVFVNNVEIPKVDSNPAGNGGWYYNAAANSIVFQGDAHTPPQGAAIRVTFDPRELTF